MVDGIFQIHVVFFFVCMHVNFSFKRCSFGDNEDSLVSH